MYISELNLHGFKSFAKKEKIKFGEGVTVIVGPNGCGKTNIVDAIRWVLGEQKYSVLRSGKMGDVIFNGADGVKPLSVCEAYLTVHNNSGKLPIEYNDIEIGRRVYRDGESEYYINKTPCRLKDIHELFIDTGMGSDAYSVIELKMIEQILSETADDRKRMFEEAAGINKYKQQRQSALRKFDAIQRDLDRINDIVQEVEQQVHSLGLQLKRFIRHEKLSTSLFEKELALAYIKIHNYDSELIPLRKNVSESLALKDEKSSDTSLLEKELEEIKKTYVSQQEDLQKMQINLQKLEKDRELAQNNVLIWSEQFKSAEININRLSNELSSNQEKKTSLLDKITDYKKDINQLSPSIKNQSSLFDMFGESVDNTIQKFDIETEDTPLKEMVMWERELIGVEFTHNPIAEELKSQTNHIVFASEITKESISKKISVIGQIANIKDLKTRRGDSFKSIQLQLLDKVVETVVWPDVLLRTENLWVLGDFISINGTLRERNGITSLAVEDASKYNFSKNQEDIDTETSITNKDSILVQNETNPTINNLRVEKAILETKNTEPLIIKIFENNDSEVAQKIIQDIFMLIEDSPGHSEVNLHVKSKNKIVNLLLPKKVEISKILKDRLVEIVGEENILIKQ